ncbi:hypothetical protein ZWY2020_058256 [Hordeum vulgare]|nr:hypothetical protein ZWY2020_058256 [Hordeum vulgare]
MVKDYSPVEDEDLEWPRIFEHKDWKMGCKDGERRARTAASARCSPAAHRNDDDADDNYNGGNMRRGKCGGARDGFWQGMRDKAHCRDAVASAPAPRRYRRHADPVAPSAPAPGMALAMQLRDWHGGWQGCWSRYAAIAGEDQDIFDLHTQRQESGQGHVAKSKMTRCA